MHVVRWTRLPNFSEAGRLLTLHASSTQYLTLNGYGDGLRARRRLDERTHQSVDQVAQHTPRTLSRLGRSHRTCCHGYLYGYGHWHWGLRGGRCWRAARLYAYSSLPKRLVWTPATREPELSLGTHSTQQHGTRTQQHAYLRHSQTRTRQRSRGRWGGGWPRGAEHCRRNWTVRGGTQRDARTGRYVETQRWRGRYVRLARSPLPRISRRCSLCVPAMMLISRRNLLLQGRS